jgi:hypothetical protein
MLLLRQLTKQRFVLGGAEVVHVGNVDDLVGHRQVARALYKQLLGEQILIHLQGGAHHSEAARRLFQLADGLCRAPLWFYDPAFEVLSQCYRAQQDQVRQRILNEVRMVIKGIVGNRFQNKRGCP